LISNRSSQNIFSQLKNAKASPTAGFMRRCPSHPAKQEAL